MNVAGDVIGYLNGVYTVVRTKAEFEAARDLLAKGGG